MTGSATGTAQAPSSEHPSPLPDGTGPVLSARALAAGSRLTVPEAGAVDWVLVGARRDGTLIRAAHGTGAISVPVAEGAAPTVATAPVTVSWSGGRPEQDHTGATTWWTAPPGSTWRVDVQVTGPGTVDLVLGDGGGPALVTATTADGVTRSLHLTASPAAWRVSVQLAGAGPDVVIRLSGGGPQGGPALLAVALRGQAPG